MTATAAQFAQSVLTTIQRFMQADPDAVETPEVVEALRQMDAFADDLDTALEEIQERLDAPPPLGDQPDDETIDYEKGAEQA